MVAVAPAVSGWNRELRASRSCGGASAASTRISERCSLVVPVRSSFSLLRECHLNCWLRWAFSSCAGHGDLSASTHCDGLRVPSDPKPAG